MKSRIYELFRQLNLPRSVASVYCALLAGGPLTVEELVRESGEDKATVANTISILRGMRLIGDDRGGLYALEPGLSWLAHVADMVWGKQTSLESVRNLPKIIDEKTELARRVCEELGLVSREIYKPHSATRNHRYHDAETSDEMAFLTCELISRAEKEIVAVSKSPRSPQVSSFWVVLTDRLEHHGVRYRRVTDLDEVEAHGLKIVLRDMADYDIDLRILERARITHQFYAVDGKLLAVEHDPDKGRAQSRRGVGRVTNYLDVVQRYRERFEQYSAAAIPGRFVVERLRVAAMELVERAQKAVPPYMVSWFEDIVDYGKFSRLEETEGWQREKAQTVEATATAAGLVRRNAYGELVANYGVTESDLRRSYDSAGS